MKQRSDFWTCPKCNGRNHFSSDSCYSSAKCRAEEWEHQASIYERKAADLRKRAAEARAEAKETDEMIALLTPAPAQASGEQAEDAR